MGEIPTVPYKTPGSLELSKIIEDYIRDSKAVILERHGVLTCAQDLNTAYSYMEIVEHTAKIIYYARQFGPISVLQESEVSKILRD